jgi:hypothetical protein
MAALAAAFALIAPLPSQAASPLARLLLSPAAPIPRNGLYATDDDLKFLIDNNEGDVRLRFAGSTEVFYLASEPAPLGGRVLKYDTGEVALHVAGWGGITLYTDMAKVGIPAGREDDAADFDPMPVDAKNVKTFAAELARELSAADGLAVAFAADWATLGQTDAAQPGQTDMARALACDAMRDATYAIENVAKRANHETLAARLRTVQVLPGPAPGTRLRQGALVIFYTPADGPSARPSSRAIARVLFAGL